jgi:hypothetical protein
MPINDNSRIHLNFGIQSAILFQELSTATVCLTSNHFTHFQLSACFEPDLREFAEKDGTREQHTLCSVLREFAEKDGTRKQHTLCFVLREFAEKDGTRKQHSLMSSLAFCCEIRAVCAERVRSGSTFLDEQRTLVD